MTVYGIYYIGPKDHIKIRTLDSGTEAQDKGDSTNHSL